MLVPKASATAGDSHSLWSFRIVCKPAHPVHVQEVMRWTKSLHTFTRIISKNPPNAVYVVLLENGDNLLELAIPEEGASHHAI